MSIVPGKDVRGSHGADGSVTAPRTGKVRLAQVFIAVVGASSYSCTEASSDAIPVGLDLVSHPRLRVLR
jgi:hypothetical protein